MDQGGLREVFYGSTQTVLTCSICPHSLVQQAAISPLSLDLEPPVNRSVNQCLEAFFTPASALDGYRCDSCGRVGTSTLSPSISAPPTILIIHLKRLFIGGEIQYQDGFGEELDLNLYMTVKGDPLIYELIGVIEHIGSHKAGHCITFNRREAAWNRCYNTIISQIALHDVLECQAYMLMYRAKTT